MDTSNKETEKIIQINLISHFYTIRAVLPDMIDQKKGHIVTIASGAGFSGISGMVDYCVSKFGTVGLDDAFRNELYMTGHSYIKTTCICPYFINTGMFEGVSVNPLVMRMQSQEKSVDRIIRGIKLEEKQVFIPEQVRFLVMLKGVTPVGFIDWLGRFLGMQYSMDTFQGRV